MLQTYCFFANIELYKLLRRSEFLQEKLVKGMLRRPFGDFDKVSRRQ
ncbi:MAG: hypothetical protein Q9M20_07585 [Mariprofundaceae bacterium]|nr:hypothetical protein [Mariprofundaceae bacterium]